MSQLRARKTFVCPHPCCPRTFHAYNLTSLKEHFKLFRHRHCVPDCAPVVARLNQMKRWNQQEHLQVEPRLAPIEFQFVAMEAPPVEVPQVAVDVQMDDFDVPPPPLQEPTEEEILTMDTNLVQPKRSGRHKSVMKFFGKLTPPNHYEVPLSLALKELSGLSDEGFAFLRRMGLLKELSSLDSIKKQRQKMNEDFKFTLDGKGSRTTIRQAVQTRLNEVENALDFGSTVEFKFSMDGASIANDLHIKQVVAAVEMISDKLTMNQQRSPYNCIPVAVSLCGETYAEMEEEFGSLLQELNTLAASPQEFVTTSGKSVFVDWTIVIDLPLLLKLLGFSSAFYLCKEYCCWLCDALKIALSSYDTNSIGNDLRQRTMEELLTGNHKGQINFPLLKVPLGKIVICSLHWTTAIIRTVLNRIAQEIDQKEKEGCLTEAQVELFANRLSTLVGTKIMDRHYKNKRRTMCKRIDSFWLTYARALSILKNYSMIIDDIFPPQRATYLKGVFASFREVWNLVDKEKLTDPEIATLKVNLDRFHSKVKATISAGTCKTAYMHLGVVHLHEMIKKRKGIARYSNHSLESLHSINKQLLRSKTSKFKDFRKGGAFIAVKQLQAFHRMIIHMQTIAKYKRPSTH